MKRAVGIIIGAIVVGLAGCSQDVTSPLVSKSDGIIRQEVPVEVQRLLDQHAVTELDPSELPSRAPSDWTSSSLTPAGYDVYAVTIIWGDFFSTEPQPSVTTNWSGRLTLNGDGTVNVTQTIDFEPNEDSVLSHDAPHFAAWISFTQGDFDGLSFLVFVRHHTPSVVSPTLTFDTPPFSASWDFRTLSDFSAFYVVDNIHAVAVHSRRVWPNMCPGGFIRGEWIKNEIFADDGYIQGLWLDHRGKPLGVLSGEFWADPDGTRKLSGTISGVLTPMVIAEVHGTWWYDDPRMCPMCGAGHGQFRGRYRFLDHGPTGSFRGEFGDYSLPLDERTLPMHGLWSQDCPSITSNDVRPSSR